jgi:hypothetical protein
MTNWQKIEEYSARIALEEQMKMYHTTLIFEFDEIPATYCPTDDFTSTQGLERIFISHF